MRNLLTQVKAFQQLGLRAALSYATYKLTLDSGAYDQWPSPSLPKDPTNRHYLWEPVREMPSPDALRETLGPQGIAQLVAEAGEIVSGQVRLFGGPPVLLNLAPPQPLLHWAKYEKESPPTEDVKFTWEPARFGWAFTLARAYHISGDERYPQAFWGYFDVFNEANPPYQGLNWVSGQEAGLRVLAFQFCGQAFSASPSFSEEQQRQLAYAIAIHARRLPPTHSYAQSQNNNHVLTEAVGIYTTGLALNHHPDAWRWRSDGWRWFHQGIRSQIAPDGAYTQNSANYHRLMLQTALWMWSVEGEFPPSWRQKLAAATRWLLAIVDPDTGRAPNLGPNDSAYILPLAAGAYDDFRPVLQAASQAFLGKPAFPPGPWDEMGLWLHGTKEPHKNPPSPPRLKLPTVARPQDAGPHVLRSPARNTWGYLRIARHTARPGHADQLHVDLWRDGMNFALDAGTYLYNAESPWDNALSRTRCHNTLLVDGQDQMTPAGRFLWLDWAQAKMVEDTKSPDGAWARLTGEHDGYRKLGAIHRRSLSLLDGQDWLIEDWLLPVNPEKDAAPEKMVRLKVGLHWLLPDWPWQVEGDRSKAVLKLESPLGLLLLTFEAPEADLPVNCLRLARAGAWVYGSGPADPTEGWVSPYYGAKNPALSLWVEREGPLPLAFRSRFNFSAA